MRNNLFLALWALVFSVALYDGQFAWNLRTTFLEWELNPLAIALCQYGGMASLFGVKYTGLAFGACVGGYARSKEHWVAWPFTIFVAGIHAALAGHYAVL
jgi:hypothetical protein